MTLADRTILVTGATGFIGTRLCAALVEAGARVHGLTRRADPHGTHGVRWHHGDVADLAFVRDAIGLLEPDLIFHLAGHVSGSRDLEHVLPAFRANLESTVNLLTAVTEVGRGRLVLAGSLEEPPEDGGPSLPASPYAASKGAASAYARMFRALYGTEVSIARLFMVYGPGQKDATKLIPYVIHSLLRGESPELSSGTRPVDWIYVDDVVEGLIALGGAQESVPEADLGSGDLTTIREVVERLVGLVGGEARPRFGALPERPMEQVRAADVEATERALGWRATTPLDEGLARTAEWVRAESAAG